MLHSTRRVGRLDATIATPALLLYTLFARCPRVEGGEAACMSASLPRSIGWPPEAWPAELFRQHPSARIRRRHLDIDAWRMSTGGRSLFRSGTVAPRISVNTSMVVETRKVHGVPVEPLCQGWCEGHESSWEQKCFFAACEGCMACLHSPPPHAPLSTRPPLLPRPSSYSPTPPPPASLLPLPSALHPVGGFANTSYPANSMTGRDEGTSYVWKGQLCLFGGRGVLPIDCFDPVSRQWTVSRSMTNDVHHVQVAVWQNEVWAVTGFTGVWPGPWNDEHPEQREHQLSNVLVYNPNTDQLRESCKIPTAFQRGAAGVVQWGDAFWIAQGATNGHLRKYGARAYFGFTRFEPDSCRWTQVPAVPKHPRDHYMAALVGSRMVLLAGRESPHDSDESKTAHYNTERVEWFDLQEALSGGVWHEAAKIPTPRAGVSVAVAHEWIVVAGGESDQSQPGDCPGTLPKEALKQVEAYDVINDTWTVLPNLRNGRHTAGAGFVPIGATGAQQLILASGVGCLGDKPLLNDVEELFFPPPTSTSSMWTAVGISISGEQYAMGPALAANLRTYSQPTAALPNATSIPKVLSTCLTQNLKEVYRKGHDAAYWSERHCKNRRADMLPQPEAIVRAHSPREVQLAVMCAAASGARICARAGGHGADNDAGCTGGLLIDVQELRELHVDTITNITTFGSGFTLGQLYSQLHPYQLVVGGGTVNDVGAAGLILGCGRGHWTLKHGLACDHVLGVQYVSATGELKVANKTHNADMYWMARGGGGNFPGIVTGFIYRAISRSELFVYNCFVALSNGKQLLRRWSYELTDMVKHPIYTHLSSFETSGKYLVTWICLGCNVTELVWLENKVSVIMSSANSSLDSGCFHKGYQEWTQLLLDEAGVEGKIIQDDPRALLDREQGWGSDDTEAFKNGGLMGTDFQLSDAIIDTIHDQVHVNRSGIDYGVGIMIYPLGSPVVRGVPPPDTAYGPRNASWVLHFKHQWIAGRHTKRQKMLAHHEQFSLALAQHLPCRGWYNYIDNELPCAKEGGADHNRQWMHAYFQDNEHRMRAIKAREDPHNLFKSRLWPRRKTLIEIRGEEWWINGRPTYHGRMWQGQSVQGTLHNARMVNAIVDDLNGTTRDWLWKYPDTGYWSPERNTLELVSNLRSYAHMGLTAMTVSLQGGAPCGTNRYFNARCRERRSRDSSAYNEWGELRTSFFERLGWIFDEADELGMVIILQLFYPDQATRVFRGRDQSVVDAADNVVDWLAYRGYRNYVIDVCNGCDFCRISACSYSRLALKSLNWPYQSQPPSIPSDHHGELPQLIQRIRARLGARGIHVPVSTSYVGGEMPLRNEFTYLDYVNMHATNLWRVKDGNLLHLVDAVRAMDTFNARRMPILFSEDDGICQHDGAMSWETADAIMMHPKAQTEFPCVLNFEECQPTADSRCAFGNAVFANVGWGSPSFEWPPNWSIDSSPNKRAFFNILHTATGGLSQMPASPSPPPPHPPPPDPPTLPSPAPRSPPVQPPNEPPAELQPPAGALASVTFYSSALLSFALSMTVCYWKFLSLTKRGYGPSESKATRICNDEEPDSCADKEPDDACADGQLHWSSRWTRRRSSCALVATTDVDDEG